MHFFDASSQVARQDRLNPLYRSLQLTSMTRHGQEFALFEYPEKLLHPLIIYSLPGEITVWYRWQQSDQCNFSFFKQLRLTASFSDTARATSFSAVTSIFNTTTVIRPNFFDRDYWYGGAIWLLAEATWPTKGKKREGARGQHRGYGPRKDVHVSRTRPTHFVHAYGRRIVFSPWDTVKIYDDQIN